MGSRRRLAAALATGALAAAGIAWWLRGDAAEGVESHRSAPRGAQSAVGARAASAPRAAGDRSAAGAAEAEPPFQEPAAAGAMGIVVSGVLTNKKGEPLAGGEARLARERGGTTLARARSGADGRFRVGLERAPQALFAEVRAPGYAARRTPRLAIAVERELDLGLLVLSRPATLAGRVATEAGRGIAGARVSVTQDRERQESLASAITNEDGGFELAGLDDGYAEVAVEADGFADRHLGEIVLLEGERREVKIALSQEKTFVGTVIDAEGRPLEGVAVFEHIVILRGPFWRTPARTDADGRFALRGISMDPIPIRLFKLGYEQRLETYSDAFKSGERYVLGASPVGRVSVVSADGSAAPRARSVHWYPELSQGHVTLRSTLEAWQLDAQPDGRILVALGERMAEAPSKLAIQLEDGSLAISEWISIPKDRPMPTREAPLEIVVRRDRRTGIAGRVLDGAGRPVARARVSAGFDANQIRDDAAELATAVADAEGRYEIRGLAVGKYLVFGPGPRAVDRAAKAETELGKLREGIDVVAQADCEVHGAVTVGGKPARLASVAAYAPTSRDYFAQRLARTVADEKGNYRIAGLAPGRAVLFARSIEEAAGFAGRSEEQGERLASELTGARWSADLAPGGRVRVDIDLAPTAWGRVVGTVLANGRALAGAQVWAIVPGDLPSRQKGYSTLVDSAGHYQLSIERPGDYEILADSNGLIGSAVARVAAGDSVTVNIPIRTGQVEGRVVDGAGRPVEAQVSLLCERQGNSGRSSPRAEGPITTSPDDGAFRFRDVQEGLYRIVARPTSKRLASARSDPFEVGPEGFVVLPPLVLQPGSGLDVALIAEGGVLAGGKVWVRSVEGSPPLLRSSSRDIGQDLRVMTFSGQSHDFENLPKTKIRVEFEPPIAVANWERIQAALDAKETPPPAEQVYGWEAEPIVVDLTRSDSATVTLRIVKLSAPKPWVPQPAPPEPWGLWGPAPLFLY